MRPACVQVLGVLDDPEPTRVVSTDVEDLLTGFRNQRKQRPKPRPLDAGKRRLRSEVGSSKDYLESPGAWKPPNRNHPSVADWHPWASNAAATSGPSASPVR